MISFFRIRNILKLYGLYKQAPITKLIFGHKLNKNIYLKYILFINKGNPNLCKSGLYGLFT